MAKNSLSSAKNKNTLVQTPILTPLKLTHFGLKKLILKNKFRNLIIFFFAFFGSALIFVLLDGFTVKKEKNGYQISSRFAQRFNKDKNSSNNEISNQKWAEEIVKGGYILHLRHAMREKFAGSVTTYDALELLNKEDARETDYYRAVCLTERGILDSKVIGKTFKFFCSILSKILFAFFVRGIVLSSPFLVSFKQASPCLISFHLSFKISERLIPVSLANSIIKGINLLF